MRLSQPVSKFARYLDKFLVTQNNDKPFLKTQYRPLALRASVFGMNSRERGLQRVFKACEIIELMAADGQRRVHCKLRAQNWVLQKSGEKMMAVEINLMW